MDLIQAIKPSSGKIETAYLYHNHFGKGRNAVRFQSDGMNAAYHAEKDIAWQPHPLTDPNTTEEVRK